MIQQGNIRFFIPPDLIEMEALTQVRNTASMPFVHRLAVMPERAGEALHAGCPDS